MCKSLILTDVDSVLLDYLNGGNSWVDLEEVDHDKHVQHLPPFRDAQSGVHKLASVGFKFHAITTVGRKHQLTRETNLYHYFGPHPFNQVTCLDLNESKYESLLPYKDSGLFWLEDSIKNANIGKELGLRSVLMDCEWNQTPFDGPRVKNWDEFIDLVEGR